MNSYNKNEYEIVDSPYSSNNSNLYTNSRYPYVNNPSQFMQNTTYEDWLNLCKDNSKYNQDTNGFIDTPDTKTAVTAAITVVGAILTYAGVPGAGAFTLLGKVVPVFWPSASDKSQNIWVKFIESIQDILGKKLDINKRNKAIDKLEGLQSVIYNYNASLKSWLENKNNSSFQTDVVKGNFIYANNAFIESMNVFTSSSGNSKEKEENVLLLPIYTHIANLHLLLLRDASFYGKYWGFSGAEINDFYSKQQQDTITHIAHCIKYYNEGLTIAKEGFQLEDKWNKFNSYRRNMTLKVLDVISLFSTYDTKRYPATIEKPNINELGKFELTREVYTDAFSDPGSSLNSSLTMDELDKKFTRGPHLFDQLIKLFLYTRFSHDTFGFTGNKNCTALINNNFCQEAQYGDIQKADTESTFSINQLINKINVTHVRNNPGAIIRMDFYKEQNLLFQYNSGSKATLVDVKTVQISNQIDSSIPNSETYKHNFSYLKTGNNPTNPNLKIRQVAFAWTHWSVDYNNTIQEKVITAIPIIKSQSVNNTTIIPNPGHLGGDFIQFNPGTSPRIELQCRASNFPTTKNYAVRIRYVANQKLTVSVSIAGRATTFITADTMAASTQGKYLYQQFSYGDVFTKSLPVPLSPRQLLTISITTLSPINQNTIFAIDRIEFIPVDEFPTLTTEQQSIETLQNQINNLFTDYTQNTLKSEVTDYQIDQIATTVDTVSEEQYSQEKMILLDEIKHAKQLSYARNLLQNGDFQDFLGWTTNNEVTIQTKNPVFKEYALYMPGARVINTSVFPTYLYQKIDESKLKPYTRYLVRGFIESSKGLEVSITRYNKDINTI
ncbi:insecticidal delta-endotoxin Cry8Ea1 family protein, partial [Bacillus mycoides]|uniref:insecticidal delta-endotoxin Cry8Ea1 family protein n=1 Tax=Bacillus mycoides TaxID=1405 RepID=UPI003D090292